jgi:hypothetical protein
MENSKFISIFFKNSIDKIQEYINTYESSKDNNYLNFLFFSTPYFSDVVRLIQAENANVKGYDAWRFKMNYSKDEIYNALISKL